MIVWKKEKVYFFVGFICENEENVMKPMIMRSTTVIQKKMWLINF